MAPSFLSSLTRRRPPNRAAALAARQGATPLRPYEALITTERWTASALRHADRLLEDGWQLPDFPPVRLEPPLPWAEADASRRSWSYHLHAWEPLGLLLSAYDHTREDRFLRRAADVALDWLAHHPKLGSGSRFAWYDMAIGLRAARLAYIVDAACRTSDRVDDEIERLIAGAELHRAALADDERFAEHTNHGFYQAAGQLALGRRLAALPGMDAAAAAATERLRRIAGRQFTGEGVHHEHSPGYHVLVLHALGRLVECDLVDDPEIRALAGRAGDALAWFIQPDGHLVQIGDTDARVPTVEEFEHPPSEHLRFVLTRGGEGAAPAERLRAFPDSGYIVMRDRWPRPGEAPEGRTHLVQICAFHSRTHKHADDLSFTWYDRGSPILVDAGRYAYTGAVPRGSELARRGFWYGHPKRVYVESTRAHNTVEIDGRSHDRRARPPYGSALRRWGERDGVLFSEAEVRHAEARHVRLLLLLPQQWLLVLDLLGGDPPGHHFTQWLHFAPRLEVATAGGGLRVTGARDPLHVVSLLGAAPLAPVRGRGEPDLLGWTSPGPNALEPLWTAGFAVEGAQEHAFATLLAFGDSAPRPDVGANRVDASGCELAWDGRHRLTLARDGREIRLEYRTA
jgi:Heparinase II/III-like protein/Heparinase II/III N-terminus